MENMINKLNQLRQELIGITDDNILDDGCDSGDVEQNARYSGTVRKTDDIISEIAGIDIDGIDCDQLWRDAWAGINSSLPEDKYNHALRYIELLKKECETK